MDKETPLNDRIGLTELNEKITQLKQELAKVIVGQEKMIDLLITAILSNGHVLLEGVPGIAKTLTAKCLAKTMSVAYSRVQFTPDLMPSDVTGTSIFNASNAKFEFAEGPVFANIVLIDEINRAPAKTQSALFEVMEERQVTVDGTRYTMKEPFLVFATQNPLEHEGTYRLPEAQLDRFMFRALVDYPNEEEEYAILQNVHSRKTTNELSSIKAVLNAKEIAKYQKLIHDVQIEDNIVKYVTQVIQKTRNHPALYLGASPRASINTLISSKAYAAMQGRDYVIPEDVKAMLLPVLNHRIVLTPEKELEGATEEKTIMDIINSVEVPR